ncbi:MAG: glutamine--fructose-6-phosphate transaminase (isomerizing) [Candidatus Liptonbacteria bacterium]|nr:glutamine--fructose-6-phosphate transaminase (isomerizing) [Candidatus Liptonbacteria bacterium]
MCGIVGYIGKEEALPILLEGIKNLEYRGYDSAGFAIVGDDKKIHSEKAVGKVSVLSEKIDGKKFPGKLGIIHSRWATHGGVTESNAHPHSDCTGKIWVAHNGIIENYKELKKELSEKGHKFKSETDTETIPHLIEEEINPVRGRSRQQASATSASGRSASNGTFQEAVRSALKKIQGTYGLAIVNSDEPHILIAARNFSPLLIGLGDGEYIVASDAAAVLKYTKNVIYLDDGEMAVMTPSSHKVFDLDMNPREKESQTIDWSPELAQKNGYPHFMLKEIFEGPEAIENSVRGRLIAEEGLVKLGGLSDSLPLLRDAKRILISGCGTAYYAGRVGEYMLEEYGGIPVKVDVSSEFRYRKPVFRKGDIFLAISQSGETADTLAALREAKEKGVPAIGVVNAIGSTLARYTDAGVYQHIGPEVGVASTKAFVSQVSILALLTILIGRQREMSLVTGRRIAEELKKIPDLMRSILKKSDEIAELARKYQKFNNFLYLGRKYNLPVAYESALKLKEISYVHAEGCSAGEMKHGPIAMIDENFPSVFIAPQDSVYEKMISNIEEVKARRGPVIAIATEGDEKIGEIADDVIFIPKTLEMLTPILSVIPLQLFAYHFGVLKGLDVDRPRNLAKSVTVE